MVNSVRSLRKTSEHACKLFFNYSKLCVISLFAKKVHSLPPEHASRCLLNEFSLHFCQESFDCDSLLANQDLIPMLFRMVCDMLSVSFSSLLSPFPLF